MSRAEPAGAARKGAACVMGIDVGGTSIKCALVSGDGSVRHAERHATGAERGPDAVVETILDITEGLAGKAKANGLVPRAVGVVVPGVVDEVAGIAVWSANVGFRGVPLRDLVGARLGLPAVLGHDVRAGGLAEARLGAGRGFGHVLFVAIGTGIAAAYVVHGSAFAGAHGAGGELGHVIVRPGGPICGCGARGCLEAVASAAAVARRLKASAETVGAAIASGDERAAGVWQETVDALADGLLTAVTLFDPEVIVVGGGLAEADDILLAPLRTALRECLTFQTEPRLVRAALGDDAGCLGAALLALDIGEGG